MLIKIIKTNNYLGQHDYVLENISDMEEIISIIDTINWTQKPRYYINNNNIHIHCFTNYDKAKIEERFLNG